MNHDGESTMVDDSLNARLDGDGFIDVQMTL